MQTDNKATNVSFFPCHVPSAPFPRWGFAPNQLDQMWLGLYGRVYGGIHWWYCLTIFTERKKEREKGREREGEMLIPKQTVRRVMQLLTWKTQFDLIVILHCGVNASRWKSQAPVRLIREEPWLRLCPATWLTFLTCLICMFDENIRNWTIVCSGCNG